MISRTRNIAASQLMLLLFVSRLFTLLMYTPKTHAAPAQTALAAIPLTALFALALLLPWMALYRRGNVSPLAIARRSGAFLTWPVALIFGVYSIMLGAYSIRSFSFFMTSAVYPNAPAWIFIICLGAAAAYGARVGLEALARSGLFAFAVAAVCLVALCLGTMSYAMPQRMVNPLAADWNAVVQAAWRGASAYADLPLFLLLASRVRRGPGRAAVGWIAASGAVFTAMAAVCVLVLGEYYGASRIFALHTLSAVAGVSAAGRLDVLFLLMWVFTAFIRAALCLYCGCVCIRALIRRVGIRLPAVASGLIAGAAALIFANAQPFWTEIEQLMATGIPMIIMMVAIPLLLLIFTRGNTRVRRRGSRWYGSVPANARVMRVRPKEGQS